MGVCSSCLGGSRSSSCNDDNSRLLFDDPHNINYGSFGDQNPASLQSDSQDVQGEAEALQKIVAQISNHLVDIFAMVPPIVQRTSSTFSGNDARLLQYQDVLAGLSSSNNTNPSVGSSNGVAAREAEDWPSDDDDDEPFKSYKVVKPDKAGPLLGGFAEIRRVVN